MSRPADHPRIPAPKIGVLLINLGTPNAPEPRRGAALSAANSCPIRASSRSRNWSGSRSCAGIILTTRPKKSAHAYRQVWTEEGSPLAVDHRPPGEGAARRVRRRT